MQNAAQGLQHTPNSRALCTLSHKVRYTAVQKGQVAIAGISPCPSTSSMRAATTGRLLLDRCADARVGAAAADVAAHGLVDLLQAGLRRALEQTHRRHDLPGLAVSALGDVVLDPGLLHDLPYAIRLHPLDARDRKPGHRRSWGEARANGRASICTVQAPHMARAQPNLVQVIPSSSRSAHSSGMSSLAFNVLRLAVDLKPYHGRILSGAIAGAMRCKRGDGYRNESRNSTEKDRPIFISCTNRGIQPTRPSEPVRCVAPRFYRGKGFVDRPNLMTGPTKNR